MQKPDLSGLAEFLKPLNEVIMKANSMTEGRRSDFFNHLKAAADSLSALAWIAYTGKDCGKQIIKMLRSLSCLEKKANAICDSIFSKIVFSLKE